jgi:hypothetical protein
MTDMATRSDMNDGHVTPKEFPWKGAHMRNRELRNIPLAGTDCTCTEHTFGYVTSSSGHMTSGDLTSGSIALEHPPKYCLNRADILLKS